MLGAVILSFKIDGEKRTLKKMIKLGQFVTTKPELPKILKWILQREEEESHSCKSTEENTFQDRNKVPGRAEDESTMVNT